MNASTLKLRSIAPSRAPFSGAGSHLAATSGAHARSAPGADVVRLGLAPNVGACPSPPPMALCAEPAETGAADHEAVADERAVHQAPAAPPSEEVCLEPASAEGSSWGPASSPPAACLEPAPEVEPHHLAAFAVSLEALDAPAFLTKPGGEIGHANAAARAWLERDRPGAVACLQEARGAAKSHDFSATPVHFVAGAKPWQLVVVRPQADREAERLARVAAASARWSLSARQREVLLLIVEGLSVPTIAAVLGCVEKTVGSHLNAIFKKAVVESRAELTAKVWMG
ncbi:MAG TPA: LuxR C-terminal-related transcriptional regulator [Polyangiaceae bacterium]|nr:LuxR C-terminal-related transcriptional regulator [Polyangiaceae bacterium]